MGVNRNFLLILALLGVEARAGQADAAKLSAPHCPAFEKPWIDGMRADEPPIQVQQIDPDTIVLRQSVRTNFEAPFLYLLFGTDSALLLDSGADGIALRAVIDRLIADRAQVRGGRRVRLIVAHSHDHRDHRAGDRQFSDRPDTIIVAPGAAAVAHAFRISNWPNGLGQIDLGGRIIDVIPTPGHQDAHIMLYDRRSRLLLSGDSLYPGRIYVPVNHFDTFRKSVNRLAQFARARPVACVLGAHIEMTALPGKDFPGGAVAHPNEHVLQLAPDSITELQKMLRSMSGRSAPQRRAHFIVVPMPPRSD